MTNENIERAVKFVNFTDEDFVGYWNSVAYDFPAGSSVFLPLWQANHFAKHLVDRVLHKAGKQVNDGSRPSLLAKAIPTGNVLVAEDRTKLDMKIMTEEKAIEVEEKEEVKKIKKPGRPKKVKDTEEFEGLA